jgi:hypothetical protein
MPKLITLDTIQPKTMTWLWHPYIPTGTITAIYGRGGMGKSYLTCDIASRISNGDHLPGQEGEKAPQKVLMLSAEDDYATVLVPRLLKLGANMQNIAVPDFHFTLDPWGIERVAEFMRNFAATVAFIDPIVYYAGGKMDINKSNEVRAMMEKLKTAAEASASSVVIVGHVKKSEEGLDQDQMMGSADWINAARSGLLVTKTNDGTKIMKHAKTNYGELGAHWGFHIDNEGFHWDSPYGDDDLPAKSSRTVWGVRADAAKGFLRAVLANGPMPAVEIMSLAKDEGIAQATLNRAKPDVAESYYDKTKGVFMWRLLASGGDEMAATKDGASQ